MEKFRNSKLILIFFLCLGNIKSFGQNVLKDRNKANAAIDSSKFSLVKSNSYAFDFRYQDKKLITIGLWDNDKISGLTIPINDSTVQVLRFSYDTLLLNKFMMKLVKGLYVEDGRNYFFYETGGVSHFYTYSDGVLNGSYIAYYPNGLTECKGSYKNGEKYGIWSYYDKNGVLIKAKKKQL
jgi:hypothetical protein